MTVLRVDIWIVAFLVGCGGAPGATDTASLSGGGSGSPGRATVDTSTPGASGGGASADTGVPSTGASTTTCVDAEGDYDPVGDWEIVAYRPAKLQGPAGTTATFPETLEVAGTLSLEVFVDGTWAALASYPTGPTTRTYAGDHTWSSTPDTWELLEPAVRWGCDASACEAVTCVLTRRTEEPWVLAEVELERR